MLADIAHQRSQSLLRQRKALLAAVAFSFVVKVALAVAVTSKDREVILRSVSPRALKISASVVSADYLEFVTRDTALMLLNRTPESLDYWMNAILKIAHPSAYGKLRAELMRIVTEQRGSDVSQAFVITGMTVDPKGLVSLVDGDLKTFGPPQPHRVTSVQQQPRPRDVQPPCGDVPPPSCDARPQRGLYALPRQLPWPQRPLRCGASQQSPHAGQPFGPMPSAVRVLPNRVLRQRQCSERSSIFP